MAITTELISLQTTDGTTTTAWTSADGGAGGDRGAYLIFVHAEEPATANQAIWGGHASYDDDSGVTLVGGLHNETGDTTAWEVLVNGGVRVQVQGAAATTINWRIFVQSING